ncbi:MAG: secondary thiamine-phosphate synthase enzyme YjbQ [bacterium]
MSTRGFSDIVDVTEQVVTVVKKSGLQEGSCMVFVSGSTAGVTTIEYEPGLVKDLPEALEKFAPSEKRYHHDDTWADGNGDAHVRAAIIGGSFTAPFKDGALMLGTWQQIVVVDCDNKSRQRRIVVQIMGK